MSGEYLIFLHEMEQQLVKLFLFSRLTSGHIFAYSSHRQILLQQCFILRKTRASRIPSCSRHGKRFFACMFFDSIKC